MAGLLGGKRYSGHRTYFAAQVGVVYLNDPDAPSIGSGLPSSWVNWPADRRLDTWAIDPSLGVSSLTLSAPRWSGATIGPEVYSRCARTYLCPRAHATDGETRNATVGNMPEGVNTIAVSARDPSGNERTSASTPALTGQGLRAEFYGDTAFTTPKTTRLDPQIDFNWGFGALDPAVGADYISVRWSGYVEAPETGTYTFQTSTDDGVRLFVGDLNAPIIDDWRLQAETARTATKWLEAGKKYRIVMEYFEEHSGAVARLRWQPPSSTSFVAIPSSRLSPPGDWKLKLDRTKPTFKALGPFIDHQGQSYGKDDDYDLWIDARDQAGLSGIDRIEFLVDNAVQFASPADCAGTTGCEFEEAWSFNPKPLAPGGHTVKVRVWDRAQNMAEQSWSVSVLQEPSSPSEQRASASEPLVLIGDGADLLNVRRCSLPGLPEVYGAQVIVDGGWAGGPETTEYFDPNLYRVSRCNINGQFVSGQTVARRPVPGGGTARLAISSYTADPSADTTRFAHYLYPSASDPIWASDWPTTGPAMQFRVIPPTTVAGAEPVTARSTDRPPHRCGVWDWRRLGDNIRWFDNPTFEINPSGNPAGFKSSQKMINAHRVWNLTQDPCGFGNEDSWEAKRGTTNSNRPSTNHDDDHNVMQFVSDPAFKQACGTGNYGQPDALACAPGRYRSSSGRIFEVDIPYRAKYPWFSGTDRDNCVSHYDVWAVSVHEVGHLLGLAHHPKDWSVMYHEIDKCDGYRLLSKGDVGGLRAIYG